ncbi:YciI family protein [Staphylococcus equorum]|uniref:YciI family protein n=1 Tax=Staphylococcus equorum TaxID=246432 RepID=UPI003D8091AA
MKYFLVKFSHTDIVGWKKYINDHVRYLDTLIKDNKLITSGPLENSKNGEKEAILIFYVRDRLELMKLIEDDPYWYKGLVSSYHIRERNPIFGSFQKPNHKLIVKFINFFKNKQ